MKRTLPLALICLTAHAQPPSVATLVDFETSTNGTTITSSIVTTATKGNTFDGWETQSDPGNQTVGSTPALTISTAASYSFSGTVSIGGTTYSLTGTRGMRATMSADNAIQLNIPSPGYQLSVGFFWRFNGAQINYSPRDLVGLRSDPTGNYQFLQAYDGPSPYAHVHWQPGGTGIGNDIDITKGQWYWVTMKHVAGGQATRIRFYDPSTTPFTLVGESTGSVSSGTQGCTAIQIGIIRYSAGSTQSADYDNFIIDTAGNFPLLPAAGTPPTITSTSPLPAATFGAVYSQTLTATGDATITWAVTSGSLPAGLSLSSGGVISGTPAAAGASTATITATNSSGSASTAFSLTVQPSWTNVLPSDRAIDWTAAGIPGGIPNRSVSVTVSGLATGTGAAAANTTAINNALSSATSGTAVMIPAGTWSINTITIPSNKTLRGAGANLTILDMRGSGAGDQFGTGSSPSSANSTSISSGSTAGSTSITVASASGISVGGLLLITELNDSSYVSSESNNGSCTWCDGGIGWNGTRVRGQIVEVTSVSGTTIGISPGLYSAFTLTPLATRITYGATMAGVENLQLYANNTGYDQNFLMRATKYCWIKGVESNYADGDHVLTSWAFRGEIRDSYFHDGFIHESGTSDNTIFITNKSSAFLVENNINDRQHVSMILNWGPAGNVVAYNYTLREYDSRNPFMTAGTAQVHGAHPQFNLIEGNSSTSLLHDSYWGTSSHNTSFRNHYRGGSQRCQPFDTRGTPNSCAWISQAVRAVQIAYTVSSFSTIGDVIGGADLIASESSRTASVVSPTTRSYDTVGYGFTWGYDNLSDTGGAANTPWNSYSTRFYHGTYNAIDSSTTWDAGQANHTLPSSFYLATKPSWWGSSPWPAIGSDISGGSVASVGGHVNTIPAQECYASVASGSAFNSDVCYYGASAGVAPTITSTSPLPDGTVGAAYSQTLTATGDATITWSVTSGSLPAGLSLSSGGAITGTPTTAGTSAPTITATNGSGSDAKALSITINAAPSGPTAGIAGKITISGKATIK